MSEAARTADVSVRRSTSGGGGERARPLFYGAGVLALGSAALLGFYASEVRRAQASVAPAVAPSEGAGPALVAPLGAAATAFLDRPVTLKVGEKTLATTWGQLAMAVDDGSLEREAARLAAAGVTAGSVGKDYFATGSHLVPLALDREKAVAALVELKGQHDRAPINAKVDLEKRSVIAEQPGFGIDIYGSLGVLEHAARSGATEVELVSSAIPPEVTREKLGNIDVSHVMGWFETRYPVVEKDRNYNLKLAAEKMNGLILMPGEEFSFNEVVGARTENEGFRVAHVIQAGEMIDGLAGGTCQISSTLHGAAFFAGLEMVFARPHSRPSAYITMGMDATVVYPTTDLKIKNPYDFPVAIRYVVAQGVVRVEVLGKERPYDKIVFEREILEEIPFSTITREEASLPIGASIIEQPGFPGYKLERRRVFFKDGKKVKTEKKKIDYPPTTEYVRIGTNPDPNLVPPPQPKLHGPMDPGGKKYSFAQ